MYVERQRITESKTPVKATGTDGALPCEHLTTDQAIALGRHVDDIAALPPTQRNELLKLASTQTDRFMTFVGRYVEQNPGKILFTTATTGLVLAEPERILGGDEIVIGPDGQPQVMSKPGMIGRAGEGVANSLIRPIVQAVLWVAVPCLAIYASIKLWGAWRRCRPR